MTSLKKRKDQSKSEYLHSLDLLDNLLSIFYHSLDRSLHIHPNSPSGIHSKKDVSEDPDSHS